MPKITSNGGRSIRIFFQKLLKNLEAISATCLNCTFFPDFRALIVHIYVYTKKSFGISKFHRLYWGIWEQKCRGRIQGCLLLGSLLPKSWKSLYYLVDIVFCVIPRPFFTLFNLAVTYLYHFIVVLSEVPTVEHSYQAVKY